MLLPLQGVSPLLFFTQGDALGYVLIAPSGRYRANADSLILDKKIKLTYAIFMILMSLAYCSAFVSFAVHLRTDI
jgi:hypothetical protein